MTASQGKVHRRHLSLYQTIQVKSPFVSLMSRFICPGKSLAFYLTCVIYIFALEQIIETDHIVKATRQISLKHDFSYDLIYVFFGSISNLLLQCWDSPIFENVW